MSTKRDLSKLDRKELIQYCTENNIDFRTKDDTKSILKKALKATSTVTEQVITTKGSKSSVKSTLKNPKNVKVTVKKESTKDSTKTVKSLPITMKIIGQNVIVVIDNKQYSKKEADRDKRNEIKSLVSDINEGKKSKTVLIDIFSKKINELVDKSKNFESLSIEELVSEIPDSKLKQAILEKLTDKAKSELESIKKTEAPVSSRGGEKPYR